MAPPDLVTHLEKRWPFIQWTPQAVQNYLTHIPVTSSTSQPHAKRILLDIGANHHAVKAAGDLREVYPCFQVQETAGGAQPIKINGTGVLQLLDVNRVVPYTAYHSPHLPTDVDMLASPQKLIQEGQLLRCDTAADGKEKPVALLNFRENQTISPTYVVPMDPRGVFFLRGHFPQVSVACTATAEIPPSLVKIYDHRQHNTWVHRSRHFTKEQRGQRLHEIAGHAGAEMLKAIPQTSIGLDMEFVVPTDVCSHCECCLEAKAKRQPVARFSFSDAPTDPGYFSVDLQDLSSTPGLGGKRYRVTYVCLRTGVEFSFPVKDKRGTAKTIEGLEVKYGYKLRAMRLDGGGEFKGVFNDKCTKLGISVDQGPRDASLAFNPNAEVAHRNVGTTTLCFMLRAGYTGPLMKYWPIIDSQSTMVRSMLPRRRYQYKSTPYEQWQRMKPDWSTVNMPGARCYVVNDRKRNGEFAGVIAYLLHDMPHGGKVMHYPGTNSVIHSKDVVVDVNHSYRTDFDENHKCIRRSKEVSLDDEFRFIDVDAIPNPPKQLNPAKEPDPTLNPSPKEAVLQPRKRRKTVRFDPALEYAKPQWKSTPTAEASAIEHALDATESDNEESLPQPPDMSSSNPAIVAYSRGLFACALNLLVLAAVMCTDDTSEKYFAFLNKTSDPDTLPSQVSTVRPPRNPKEAAKDPLWYEAMMKEYNGLLSKEVFEMVDVESVPKGTTILRPLWCFEVKRDGTRKARMVAQGNTQPDGDYYAPTAPTLIVRLMLAIAAYFGYVIRTCDIKQAFLNASLQEEEVEYMYCPYGFPHKKGQVLKLKKALYGLRQAPLRWSQTISAFLTTLPGITQSSYDECLFYGEDIYLVYHVDDFLIVGESAKADALVDAILAKFEGKRTELDDFCSISIKQTSHGVSISGEKQIAKALMKNGFNANLNAATTPMTTCMKMEGELDMTLLKTLQQLIGSLLFIAMTTRPDIAFAVIFLARLVTMPKQSTITAAKRIFRYLKGTTSFNLHYPTPRSPGKYIPFEAYVDAGTQCESTRKWTSGHILLVNKAPVAWTSKRQPIIALSTCEAELIALSQATMDVLYIRHILAEFKLISEAPTTIHCDNLSAIQLVTQPHARSASRTKHIDTRYKFARQQQQEFQAIRVVYVQSAKNLADGLTKPLPKKQHEDFRSHLNPHFHSAQTSQEIPMASVAQLLQQVHNQIENPDQKKVIMAALAILAE